MSPTYTTPRKVRFSEQNIRSSNPQNLNDKFAAELTSDEKSLLFGSEFKTKDLMNIILLKSLTQGSKGPCVPVQQQVDTAIEKYNQERLIEKRSKSVSERSKEIVGDLEKANAVKDQILADMEYDLTEFETEINILQGTGENIEEDLRIRLQELRENEEKYMNIEVQSFRREAELVKNAHRIKQQETKDALQKMKNDMITFKEQRGVEQKMVNRDVARAMAEILIQQKIKCNVDGTISEYLILMGNDEDGEQEEVRRLAQEFGIAVTDYPTNKPLLFDTGSRYPVFVGEL